MILKSKTQNVKFSPCGGFSKIASHLKVKATATSKLLHTSKRFNRLNQNFKLSSLNGVQILVHYVVFKFVKI